MNVADYLGYTPLHHAAGRGNNELIHYLVEQGADPLAISRSGQSTVDMANGPVSLGAAPFPETIFLLESPGRQAELRLRLLLMRGGCPGPDRRCPD